MNTTRINTWPAATRHAERDGDEFWRTMGVDVAASQTRSLRQTYRYARQHGLNAIFARITIVHAFQAGQRTARDLSRS